MLFMWDDLLDVPDSRLVDDERGGRGYSEGYDGCAYGVGGGCGSEGFWLLLMLFGRK